MDSAIPASGEFEYTVHDSRGIVGVKDGREYPISEEEWQKAHPEHRNTECKECVFVQDEKTLLTFFVSREIKERATEEPVFVGKFTMPGWTGHSGFYLFRCKECEEVCVDYPHGYTDFGLMYLRCGRCEEACSLEVVEMKSIYERDGIHIPKPTREERMKELNEMVADTEKRTGIKVAVISSKDRERRGTGYFKFLRDYFDF